MTNEEKRQLTRLIKVAIELDYTRKRTIERCEQAGFKKQTIGKYHDIFSK